MKDKGLEIALSSPAPAHSGALAALRMVVRILLRATDERQLLLDCCRAVSHVDGYREAFVATLGADGGLEVLAEAGQDPDPRGWLAVLESAGRVQQLAAGPVLLEGEGGSGAALALPLLTGADHGRGLPFLVVGGADAAAVRFPESEVAVLEELAADVGHALVVLRRRGEHRQAEAYRDRLVELVESTSDLIGLVTPDGTVVYRNPALCDALGVWPGRDLTGRRVESIFFPEEAHRLREHAFPRAIRNGRWRGGSALRRGNGGRLPVSLVVLAHRGREGDLQYLSLSMRPVEAGAEPGMAAALSREDAPYFPEPRLPVHTGAETLLLKPSRLCFLQAEGHYTRIHSRDGVFLSSQSLGRLEKQLRTAQFKRVHRSYLVNVDCIRALEREDTQHYLVLDHEDSRRVPVSRGKIAQVRAWLGLADE